MVGILLVRVPMETRTTPTLDSLSFLGRKAGRYISYPS